MKLSRIGKGTLVDMAKGRTPTACFETMFRLVEAGLVAYDSQEGLDGDCYSLTDAGRDAAERELEAMASRRRRSNASARARSAAMRSLGMVRVAGGWE